MWKRYAIWILAPLIVLVAIVMLATPDRRHNHEFDEGSFVHDGSVGRIVRTFEPSKANAGQPLYEVNRDGLPIEIHIDPATWSRMLYPANRSVYRERQTSVTIKLADRAPVAATVELRGGGSLTMPDKPSFNCHLLRAEELTPELKLKHFYLMNARFDPHGVKVRFAKPILDELGLSSLHIQWARVMVNGKSLGLFHLIEPPPHAIRRLHEDSTAIYRRTQKNWFERLWFKSVPRVDVRIDRLTDLGLARSGDGAAIADAYDEILDVDQFLTWLAVNSSIANRDTTDELFLYETRSDPEQLGRFQVLAWDYDDILVNKHRAERVQDPLLFVFDDVHERHVQKNPVLNARYRKILGRLLENELSLTRLLSHLHAVQVLRDSLDENVESEVTTTLRAARQTFVAVAEKTLRDRHAELRAALAMPATKPAN